MIAVVATAVAACAASASSFHEPMDRNDAPRNELPKAENPIASQVEDDELSSPFSFSLNYAVYSDYVFRGVNYSEYPGEGREKPNHQLTALIGVDLGRLFGQDAGAWGWMEFETWFEWFAGQKRLDPIHGGQNLQETDYALRWSLDVEAIQSTLTLGYVFYTYPNAHGDNSMEWSLGLEHNDAWLWRGLWPDREEGILNPSITFHHDVQELAGASWLEVGVEHPWAMTDAWTLTPAITFAVDHRYLDRALQTGRTGSTRLAYIQYGLTADLDLNALLKARDDAGVWTLSVFLFFNQAVGHPRDSGQLADELFGGMSIGWEF